MISAEDTHEPFSALSPDLSVANVLARWPASISVFLSLRMGCVGCHMNAFDTLADAAWNYGFSLPEFLHELSQAIRSSNFIDRGKGYK